MKLHLEMSILTRVNQRPTLILTSALTTYHYQPKPTKNVLPLRCSLGETQLLLRNLGSRKEKDKAEKREGKRQRKEEDIDSNSDSDAKGRK